MDSHQQPGSLFNGMITPLANLTIRSAIWYQVGAVVAPRHPCCAAVSRALIFVAGAAQGENNGANSDGSFTKHSGYNCLLPVLVDSWRATFAASGGTSADLPVGVVSLHVSHRYLV
jgi:hypothetical protein